MTKYAELRLRIDRGVGRGSYRIVATGPAGEALGRFKLPFSDMELENFILKVGATRRGRRRIDSPEMDLAKTFGTKLFGALFEGDVRELYRSSFSETRAAGQGLRVTLSLTGAPELLQVPWEYMYDHPSFLSISTWTPIVRYLDLPKPRRPLQVALPIRILAMVSSPNDAEAIDAQQERAKLEAALGPLIESGAIAIDWLQEASLRALQRQLRRGEYHVFHFIGHGGYDQDADDGVLLFQDEVGRGRRVSGIQLGTILADEVSLRLAVLNSCEGARSSLQDPFSGVATSLIEREIPAVIGMQFEITDRAAIVFAGEFYSALADGLPVDSSVAEARKAIYADQNDIEWGTPVLFMRVADGRLFDVQSHAPIRAREGGPPVAAGAGAAAAKETVEPATDEGQSAKEDRERVEEERLARADAAAAERDRAVAAASVAAGQLEEERREEERLAREAVDAAERQRADVERHGLEAARIEDDGISGVAGERPKGGPAAPAGAERAGRAGAEGIQAERADQEHAPREGAGRVPEGAAAATVMVSSPTLAGVRASDVGVPFLPARTAARAGLGSVTGLAIVLLWLGMTPDWIAVVVFAVALAVTLCERRWPSVRVPGGSAYGFIGRNRWAAAGIEGAVAGGTVGYAASVALRVTKGYGDELTLYAFLLHLIATGVGFVVAEAVLHRFVPDVPRAAAVPPAVIEGSIAGNPPAELSGARPPSIDVRSRTGRDASSGPFRLRTAGARAALGTLVGFAGAIVLTSIVWPSVIEETGDRLLSTLVTDAVLLVFTITLAVSLIERWSPAFRVPDGRLYGSVGRNRYAASAIEGFVAGGIVGGATSVLIAVWRNDQSQLGPMAFVLPAVFAALDFVIAEAVIHALRRRPGRSNAA